MRTIYVAGATGLALLLTGAASAKKKPEDPAKVVCRLEQTSGTRIGGRTVCQTRAEWQAEDEARRLDLERSARGTWDQTEQDGTRGAQPGARLGAKGPKS